MTAQTCPQCGARRNLEPGEPWPSHAAWFTGSRWQWCPVGLTPDRVIVEIPAQ